MAGTTTLKAVQVFSEEGTKLSATFHELLDKARHPIIVVAYGRTGSGKSTLLNQLLVGEKEGMSLVKYEKPFQADEGSTPVTRGAQAAVIRLKDLLANHRCGHTLISIKLRGGAAKCWLTGEEEVFIVDTEGLESAEGHTTYLFAQLWALMNSAACCLWVQRGSRPTTDEFEQMFSVVKMSTRSAQIMVGQLCKDLLHVKKGETLEQVKKNCTEQCKVLVDMLSDSKAAATLGKKVADMVRDHELVVECFPNMYQADMSKSGARPAYWGTFQHLLKELCHHLCHIQLPSGTDVAGTLEEQLSKVAGLENIGDIETFGQLYTALATSEVKVVLQRGITSVAGTLDEKGVGQLVELSKQLEAEPGECLLAMAKDWDKSKLVAGFAEQWPETWQHLATEAAARLEPVVLTKLAGKVVQQLDKSPVVKNKYKGPELVADISRLLTKLATKLEL